MAFPIKNYLYLQEVSKRWRRSIKDVEYCIENGLIPVYIKVFSVKLSTKEQAPRNSVTYSGCKCISPDDCHFLFRHHKQAINKFISDDGQTEEFLIQPQKIIIKRIDLMIFLKDLQNFEKTHQLSYEEELPLFDNNKQSELSDNVLTIHKTHFCFGPLQARIIKILYQAALSDNPWVLGKNILFDCGARTQHLMDLFKSHPISERILYKAKGYYRLNID